MFILFALETKSTGWSSRDEGSLIALKRCK